MYQRILVPIDGSSTANRGVDEAIRLARLAGAKVRLLHVLDELIFVTGFESGSTYAGDVLPMLQRAAQEVIAAGSARVAAAGVAMDSKIVECFGRRASDVIIEEAETWPADLIVLGTHGRRGIGRALLGSDAEQIARLAPVPVLLVRSSEAVKRARA